MIGLIIGFVAVIITFLLKGVSPVILINLPSISSSSSARPVR